jgi:hypothetical protein
MNKLLVIGIAALAAAGALGATTLSAYAVSGGGQAGAQVRNGTGYGSQASLESRAQIVGMTAKELEAALQSKTMSEIAKEKGMSQADFEAKMEAAAKARWEARGLSAEEIAARLAEREKRQSANHTDHEWGSGDGNHQGGYGRIR